MSKVTANPESREMMRGQQKMAMAILYKSFTKQLKLGSEQSDKLNELLADHVMDNVENVTKVLRDKLPPEKMNGLFAAQEAALQQQIGAILGPDGLAQYQDYTRNLQATIMSDEFRAKMTGTDAERDAKVTQLRQTLEQETQAALADAGLPADYQVFPILNFANIASEQQAEQSLKLLGDI